MAGRTLLQLIQKIENKKPFWRAVKSMCVCNASKQYQTHTHTSIYFIFPDLFVLKRTVAQISSSMAWYEQINK